MPENKKQENIFKILKFIKKIYYEKLFPHTYIYWVTVILNIQIYDELIYSDYIEYLTKELIHQYYRLYCENKYETFKKFCIRVLLDAALVTNSFVGCSDGNRSPIVSANLLSKSHIARSKYSNGMINFKFICMLLIYISFRFGLYIH